MNKILSAALALTVCFGALTACEDSNKKPQSTGIPQVTAKNADGEYSRLEQLLIDDELARLYQTDADIALAAERHKVCALKLEDGRFSFAPDGSLEGSYTLEDGQVYFQYEKFMYDTTTADSPNNPEEPSTARTEYSVDEFTFTDDDDVLAMDIPHRIVHAMQYCNDSGSYIYGCNTFAEKRWMDWNYQYFPLFPKSGAVSIYVGAAELEPECRLYSVGDLLCRETAGVALNGIYKTGEPFTISFNFAEHEREDPCSTYSYRLRTEGKEAAEELLSNATDYVMSQLGTDSLDTLIEFEDGKWQWLDSSGSIINSGDYRESTEYSGFTIMYMTEDSPSYDRSMKIYDFAPLMLYISGDNIYCPEFIRQ